jgi:DNA-binding transcriptional LysR family regulator
MNVHHLELFYYVARHGGITEAVRNIPYGIQQPAVSGQVAALEEFLGVTLFQRRPFALTPPGEKLYQFIQPFFANLDSVGSEIQGGRTRRIRVGASTVVLRDHLPELFQRLRKKFPKLSIGLREGYQAELEKMLNTGDIDLAVTVIEKQSAPGIRSAALIELPLVLLAEKDNPVSSAAELWRRDKIEEPLICLPEHEAISRSFQHGLKKLGVDWFTGLEVSSLGLIETYVASGFGIGVTVRVPRAAVPPNVRLIPLPDFPPVVVGALWRGRPSAIVEAFIAEMQAYARRLG